VQFTFGIWQDQQLRQQQKSVVSGSSNSACNSATLRALRYMPVTLTSDLTVPTVGDAAQGTSGGDGVAGSGQHALSGAEVAGTDASDAQQATDSDVSSSDDDDEIDVDASTEEWVRRRAERAAAKELRQAQMRRVSLRWPSPYSYCLQHVMSGSYDGYYCPPMPPAEEEKVANTEGVDTSGADTSGKKAEGEDALDAGVFGTTADNAQHEWLCIYKALK
jgi:hypothetical protein